MIGYFVATFLGTLVFEDVALAGALILVAQQKLSLEAAFLSSFLGIAIGTMALYGIGIALKKYAGLQKYKYLAEKMNSFEAKKDSHSLTFWILASRAIPGTRVPVYLGAGFLGYPIWRFTWLTILSVTLWVAFILLGGKAILEHIEEHFFIVAAIVIVFIVLIRFAILKFRKSGSTSKNLTLS